jgi:hypothetical protein
VRSVLLSEAFTLSVQRSAKIRIAALASERCTDSVNTSLSGAFGRALRAGVGPGVRFNRPRRGLAKARGASVSPNKPMQRTVETAASFLRAQRAAADRQRYASV